MNDETAIRKQDEEPLKDSFPEKEYQNKSIQSLYEWMEAAVFSLTFVVLVFSFLFRIVGVDGNSMNDTLKDNDRLIITDLAYTPKQGDIVIINRYAQDPTREPLVKRVIAVEGDTVEINADTNQVIVNGVVQNEPYIKGKTYPLGFDPNKQIVPKGYVFVMGDNREDSLDSRYFGFFKQSDIMGKAIFRFLPMNTARKL